MRIRHPTDRGSWAPAVAFVAAVAGGLALAAWGLGASAARSGLGAREAAARGAFALLTIELLAVAVGTPALVAWAAGPGRPLPGTGALTACVAVPLVTLALLGAGVCAVATGGRLAGRILGSQAFVLCFAALLVGGMAALVSLGCGPTAAQWAASLVALAMVGSAFYVNPIIAAFPSPGGKLAVARATLWTNPWLILGGTILQVDPLRAQRLYEWCIIGDYQFPVGYPGSGAGGLAQATLLMGGIYAGAGALLGALSWPVRRCNRPRNLLE